MTKFFKSALRLAQHVEMHASLHVVAMLFNGTFYTRRISETRVSLHASLHVASLKAL